MADRNAIPAATKLRLFSDAAGHCQRPECLDRLFPVEMGGDKHIAEMAHVIPHGEKGPRHADRPAENFDVDSSENLLLLCPTCHTKIDKDPDAFSRALLLDWKQNHLANLAIHQGIKVYAERQEARAAVQARMEENGAIWRKFAPCEGIDFEYDPESESARLWTARMRSVILPNHYQLQAIVAANLHHANAGERAIFAEYREHVRGLVERHVCGIAGSAIRFPKEMAGIFS